MSFFSPPCDRGFARASRLVAALGKARSNPPVSVKRASRPGFTLIELLVVIAIIAVLAVVVILTLNPVQLFAQARDSSRLQDLGTLSETLNVAASEFFTPSAWGNASTTYLSVIDPTATSTGGTDCTGVGLAAPAGSGLINHCAASSTDTHIDGTGWLPIDLRKMSTGSPLSSLPVDPANTTSSNAYYTYQTSGAAGRYKLTAFLESQKYTPRMVADGGIDAAVYETGNELTLPSAGRGLVGYWNFDEGGGSVVLDESGNGNTGAWNGTGSHYGAGKVGGYAGQFSSSTNDYVLVGSSAILNPPVFTVAAWANPTAANLTYGFIYSSALDCCGSANGINLAASYSGSGHPQSQVWNTTKAAVLANTATTANAWQYIVSTYDGASIKIYVNGLLDNTAAYAGGVGSPATFPVTLGRLSYLASGGFNGLLDDIRIYNRVLSPAEIQDIYTAER